MGMSIDIHAYDYFEMIKQIRSEVANKAVPSLDADRNINDFVERVMPHFGFRSGDKFISLWCDYYSDSGYNSASEFNRAVELYFGIDDVFLDCYDSVDNANAYEVLEELGIEPIEVGEEDE